MNIPFRNIPPNIRTPLFYAEVNNQNANTASNAQRTLIIGQITSSGAAPANTPLQCQGTGDAITQGGAGSMLALMTAAYIVADPNAEIWYLPLADAGGSTAAAGSIAFTAAPTAAGTLSLYIAGVLISQPVLSTQTAAQVAAALVATINGTPNLPVTAAVDGSISTQVDLTAVNAGLAGNDIDIRFNYGGTLAGEATPAGVTYTITAMTGGATNPILTTGLANLGDKAFDFIVCPYTDSASLNALDAFLNDTTGRWSYQQQIYGHYFVAARATVGNLQTLGNSRNGPHATIMGFYDSPTPNWIWAADVAGTAAASLRVDPGLPLQTLALSTALAPPVHSRFPKFPERNTLLYNGISTFDVSDAGVVSIENLITTYQKNTFNQADDSYLEVETMFLLMYVIRALFGLVTTKYSRMKVAANGTRFAAGSPIVTPNIIGSDLTAQYMELEDQGYVQDADAFAAGLIVQQNAQNPNRVDVYYDPTLIDQLRVFALLMAFRN